MFVTFNNSISINLDKVQYVSKDFEVERGVLVFLEGEELGMKIAGVDPDDFGARANGRLTK